MGAKHAAKRDAVNQAAVAALEGRENSGVGNVVKDMLSLLSLRNSLSGISSEMSARFTGANTANERNAQRAMLSNSFRNLAMEAVKLLPENVHESQTFSFLGQTARLVKGDDGKLAAIVTDGHVETKVDLKIGAEELVVRVITGAAFRNSEFMLDGLEKLMSAEGRGALADANIRDKAKAILGKVLDKSKGGFAFNIVYRLQAAVSELQKLGLELPPQINCFIQSLVRLSNTVTEMNTIMNQCKAMLDSANKMTCPVPERDELDLVGQQFFASEDGKQLVNGKPKYATEAESARFGGSNADMATMFTEDGELRLTDRLDAERSGYFADADGGAAETSAADPAGFDFIHV